MLQQCEDTSVALPFSSLDMFTKRHAADLQVLSKSDVIIPDLLIQNCNLHTSGSNLNKKHPHKKTKACTRIP